MDIPKKIKVGNITYKVKFKKLKKCFGLHEPEDQELILSLGMSKEMTRNTFMHELVHAIFFQIGAIEEKRSEILVQSVANELDKLFELKPQKK
jgi:hypothetical protein